MDYFVGFLGAMSLIVTISIALILFKLLLKLDEAYMKDKKRTKKAGEQRVGL